MIGEVLPAGVASCEAFTDRPESESALFPEELTTLGRAVAKRRREFITVRVVARQAMAELGIPATPILPGDRGAPVWPDGVVGSLTHCDGYRACAIAHQPHVATIGIDAESHAPLPREVRDMVAREEEQALLDRLEISSPAVSWDRLLFSAKESVYKAWFPLARRWLDFSEATLQFSTDQDAGEAPDRGSFTAQLLVPGPAVAGRPLTSFTGRWLVRDGIVLTAIAVPQLSG